MEIKQLEPKEKIITFFGEIKNTTIEAAIKDIAKKTSITDTQLNDVVQNRRDWFLTAEEAFGLGIVTDII
jgi:ATP-dependent protease ClpP protease subunit